MAPQEEEVDEPDALLCPITREVFKDPVFVGESGNTYERGALESFWKRLELTKRDPLTNKELTDTSIFVNWDKRREVQRFLDAHPSYAPQGWSSRAVPRPTPIPVREQVGWWRSLLPGLIMMLVITGPALLASFGGTQEPEEPSAPLFKPSHWKNGGLEDEPLQTTTKVEVLLQPTRSSPGFQSKSRKARERRERRATELPTQPDMSADKRMLYALLPSPSTIALNCTTEQSVPHVSTQQLVLTILPQPFWSSKVIPTLCFAAFWNGFLFVWITTAWRGGAHCLFLMFAVPFVLVGVQLVQQALAPLLLRTELQLNYSVKDQAHHDLPFRPAGLVILRHFIVVGTQQFPVLDLHQLPGALLHYCTTADNWQASSAGIFPPPATSSTREGEAAMLSVVVDSQYQRQHQPYDHPGTPPELRYTQLLQLTTTTATTTTTALPAQTFKFGATLTHAEQHAVIDVVRVWLKALGENRLGVAVNTTPRPEKARQSELPGERAGVVLGLAGDDEL
jgi:hypothetical protein